MAKAKKITAKNGVTGRQKLLKTFSIDFTSPIDDVRYTGRFTTKKLSIADLSTVGVRKAQLNGGMHHDILNPGMGVDSQTDDFNAMIAHLDVALQETPDWWDLEKVSDGELLASVFEEVAKHENSFLASRQERADRSDGSEDGSDSVAAGQEVGSGDQDQAGASGAAGTLVDEEVYTALEP